MIYLDRLQDSKGSSDWMKIAPNTERSVLFLEGPCLLPTTFGDKTPRQAIAVYDINEKRVMLMDSKPSIVGVIKAWAKTAKNPDFSRVIITIGRTGAVLTDTRYQVSREIKSEPYPGYADLEAKGKALLEKHRTKKSSPGENLESPAPAPAHEEDEIKW